MRLTDYAKVVDDLANAISVQRDSRGARRLAQGAIEAALARGSKIVADLDVTVPNALRADTARLAVWAGARRMDDPSPSGDARPETPTTEAVPNPSGAAEPLTERRPPAGPDEETLKTAA